MHHGKVEEARLTLLQLHPDIFMKFKSMKRFVRDRDLVSYSTKIKLRGSAIVSAEVNSTGLFVKEFLGTLS